jgi:glutamate racemase
MKIGVFDSGFGGLTVVKDILQAFPYAKILYVGDNARVPYGNKSKKTIIEYSKQIASFLLSKKVDVIVIACNTASSFAFDEVKRMGNIPVLGMIEPVIDEAINFSGYRKIGVIGTTGTINSQAYEKAIYKKDKKIKVVSQACPMFVPMVEEGLIDHKAIKLMAREYLSTKLKNVDCIILGCTHYPLISRVIKEVVGTKIKLLTCGEPTAREIGKKVGSVKDIIKSRGRRAKHEFYTTDDVKKFKELGSMFLGQKIDKVRKLDLDKIK